jgi:hypothetical protein
MIDINCLDIHVKRTVPMRELAAMEGGDRAVALSRMLHHDVVETSRGNVRWRPSHFLVHLFHNCPIQYDGKGGKRWREGRLAMRGLMAGFLAMAATPAHVREIAKFHMQLGLEVKDFFSLLSDVMVSGVEGAREGEPIVDFILRTGRGKSYLI